MFEWIIICFILFCYKSPRSVSWRRRRSSRMYTTRSWCWNWRRWNDHNNPLSVPHPQDIHLSDTLPPTHPFAQLQVCKLLFFSYLSSSFPHQQLSISLSLSFIVILLFIRTIFISHHLSIIFSGTFHPFFILFILVVSSPHKIYSLISQVRPLFITAFLIFSLYMYIFSKW